MRIDLRGHHCCVDADGQPIPQSPTTYVVCPEKTEHPELWRGCVGVTVPSHGGTLINLVPCSRHGTIVCWPWHRRTHLFTWARLWWRVAVRWVRGIE